MPWLSVTFKKKKAEKIEIADFRFKWKLDSSNICT